MKCIYRNFKEECNWEECPARMQIESKVNRGIIMHVCALAYNGTPLPNNEQEKRIKELEELLYYQAIQQVTIRSEPT